MHCGEPWSTLQTQVLFKGLIIEHKGFPLLKAQRRIAAGALMLLSHSTTQKMYNASMEVVTQTWKLGFSTGRGVVCARMGDLRMWIVSYKIVSVEWFRSRLMHTARIHPPAFSDTLWARAARGW